MTNQKINSHKSEVFFPSCCPDKIKTEVCKSLGIREGSFPMKYLGSNVNPGKVPTNLQYQMVDKAICKVDSWASKTISQAGKVTLLNSVMNSIPIHTLSTTWINEKVIEKYKSVSKKFMWQTSVKKKAFHLLSWDKVTANKASGGLGVRDLSLFRFSLLAKRVLPFLNKSDCLWAKVLRVKYENYHP
ncbi:hypothetical protein Cni_G17889 [Canna indica]|uniref:Reverse transcriptase n=1 Tax=Canna indica TaxID=4628 RepID=A0AAQ3QH12_9LILI|nr:hypothetical protein Cni_G17889 [Canna indica]